MDGSIDQMWSNLCPSGLPYYLCIQAAVVTDPFLSSFLEWQPMVGQFPISTDHISRGEGRSVSSSVFLYKAPGAKKSRV